MCKGDGRSEKLVAGLSDLIPLSGQSAARLRRSSWGVARRWNPAKQPGSGEVSRETPRREDIFKDADERPVQPLAKAYPLAKAKAPMPFQPSVSSSAPSYPILTKHAYHPPAAIAPVTSDHAVGDPPTPRMRRPHPRAEIDPAQWNAQMEMLWAKFPEDDAPVLG